MPTLLDELALGIVLVERIDAREPEKEKHSSSGQMELDEQPIKLVVWRKVTRHVSRLKLLE